MAIFVKVPKGYKMVRIPGETQVLAGPVVFKTVEKDVHGRPSLVQVGYIDTKFVLVGSEEFHLGAIAIDCVEIRMKEQEPAEPSVDSREGDHDG